MALEQIPVEPAQVMRALREKATSTDGADNFRMRIMRRDAPGAPPFAFATFDGATLMHFSQPELWLPQLANGGGGYFELHAYHGLDSQLLGIIKHAIPDAPARPMDHTAPDQITWAGPRRLLTLPTAKQREETTASQPFTGGFTPVERTPILRNQQPNQTPMYDPFTGALLSGGAGQQPAADSRMIAFNAELQRQQRELQEEKARLREEAIKREGEQKLREVEMRMASDRAAMDAKLDRLLSQPKEPQKNIAETVAAVLAVVSPMVERIFSSRAEADARAQTALQAAQAQQQALMLKVMESKEDSFKMMAPMIEAMQSASVQQQQMSMQMLHTMIEIQPEQENEPAYLKVIREVLNGVQATIQAQANVQEKAADKVRQQMGNGTPTPKELRAPPNVPQMIEDLIKKKGDPEQVVKLFVRGVQLRNLPLMNELQAHNGDPIQMMASRLTGWAMDTNNQQYLQKLMEHFNNRMEQLDLGAQTTQQPAQQPQHTAPVELGAEEEEDESGEPPEEEEQEEELEIENIGDELEAVEPVVVVEPKVETKPKKKSTKSKTVTVEAKES